jgi:hypothetical protein
MLGNFLEDTLWILLEPLKCIYLYLNLKKENMHASF